jgi:hypothetical protein
MVIGGDKVLSSQETLEVDLRLVAGFVEVS